MPLILLLALLCPPLFSAAAINKPSVTTLDNEDIDEKLFGRRFKRESLESQRKAVGQAIGIHVYFDEKLTDAEVIQGLNTLALFKLRNKGYLALQLTKDLNNFDPADGLLRVRYDYPFDHLYLELEKVKPAFSILDRKRREVSYLHKILVEIRTNTATPAVSALDNFLEALMLLRPSATKNLNLIARGVTKLIIAEETQFNAHNGELSLQPELTALQMAALIETAFSPIAAMHVHLNKISDLFKSPPMQANLPVVYNTQDSNQQKIQIYNLIQQIQDWATTSANFQSRQEALSQTTFFLTYDGTLQSLGEEFAEAWRSGVNGPYFVFALGEDNTSLSYRLSHKSRPELNVYKAAPVQERSLWQRCADLLNGLKP